MTALGTLGPHHRSALVLVDAEGQICENTAVVLGAAVGIVRSRLLRRWRVSKDELFKYARDHEFTAAPRP